MYIMNPMSTVIYCTDFMERIMVVDKDDASLLIGSYSSQRTPVTMARYTRKEAREVLAKVFQALGSGDISMMLPDSALFYEEKIKEDSRTRRKGGS